MFVCFDSFSLINNTVGGPASEYTATSIGKQININISLKSIKI